MSTMVVDVKGMTCQHCVSSVTTEVSGLPGVTEVKVNLEPTGVSSVTVVTQGKLSPGVVAAAIAEAGYTMVGSSEVP
jgi:copper chaperone